MPESPRSSAGRLTSRRGGVLILAPLLVALAACATTGSGGTGPPPGAATSSVPADSAPTGCPTAAPTASEAAQILSGAGTATVKTNRGTFTIELYGDKAPIATANFVALARCGFYGGITFHRVIPGFVIQAGDPQTRTRRDAFDQLGTGGPGYGFAIEPPAQGLSYDADVVAMANASAPDTNGSQFFIDLADLNGQLSRDYTIFGKVVDGTDVVDAIGRVQTTGTADGLVTGVPVDPVVIESVTVSARSS